MDWTDFPRESTVCKLCGGSSWKPLSIQRSWPVVKCRECGLVYLRERPSEDALQDLYSESYYQDGDVGYRGYVDTFNRYNDIFMKIFSRRHRDLVRHTTGRRLLEVGCAYGFLLNYLRKRGWSVTGVEVSPLSAGYARDELNLPVHVGDVETADLPEGGFDVILLLDVLEHLHRPFDALSAMGRLLAPAGTLVVQCPWELSHWEEVAQAILRGKKPLTIEPDAVPAHLYFFSPRTLEGMLKKAGYRISGRQSGNYGAVRRKIDPPSLRGRWPVSLPFRFLYYRAGLQRLLYGLAKTLHLGNGIIRYARYQEDFPQ